MSRDVVQSVIVDAGVGNLGNLARAVRHVGGEPTITTDPEIVAASRCIFLPGVGAFKPPRERLRGGLEEALATALDRGAWLLGICVGFQLLFAESEEFGATDGLGLLPGKVERLPEEGISLPHIGWNPLRDIADHALLDGVEDGDHVYFVHSYAPLTAPDEVVLARATHGASFVAVAGRGRVLGTQFHPEKSGRVGLRLIENFLSMSTTSTRSTTSTTEAA